MTSSTGVSAEALQSVSTPDRVESLLGTLVLRLYNRLQPFFDKTWRPSEIEPLA